MPRKASLPMLVNPSGSSKLAKLSLSMKAPCPILVTVAGKDPAIADEPSVAPPWRVLKDVQFRKQSALTLRRRAGSLMARKLRQPVKQLKPRLVQVSGSRTEMSDSLIRKKVFVGKEVRPSGSTMVSGHLEQSLSVMQPSLRP